MTQKLAYRIQQAAEGGVTTGLVPSWLENSQETLSEAQLEIIHTDTAVDLCFFPQNDK